MRVIDLDQIDDEEERKKVLESYQNKMQDMQNERNSYLQQTGLDKVFNGDYSDKSDGFEKAGRNDFSVKPSIWDQIKTTASNMLGNTGYGLGNGLIGFAQNERRNQTTTKTLKALGDTVLNQTLLGLPNALGRIGKSIDSTFKNNEKYQNAKNIIESTIEKNKNVVLNPIDEKLQKQEDINNENIQKNIIETTNPVGEKLVEIAPSLGQMLPSMIPGIGTLYSVGSANDSYYDEAKARGMSEEQASNYSQLMGGVEGLTEQIGIGKLVKGGKSVAKGSIKEAFKELGIGVTDNFIQEAVTEPASELVAKATAGDKYLKNDYRTSEGWKNLGKDMLQAGFDGAITAGIMGGVSAGLGASVNVYNKLTNNENVTTKEIKTALDEARNNGIDVDGMIQDEFKNRINQSKQNTNQATDVNNLNTQTNTQQDIANRLNEIVKNDKYLSQEDKESMIYATNNLASKNQLDSKNTLDAINQIKQMSQLSQEQNEQLDTGKKYLSGRKEIYNKYRNVTDYDNQIVQQAKDTVAPNKQGKRTKEQWLDVAKYIGTNIADRSNSEIQKIAYKSWQEETPNNSATLNKQGQKYVKFMSDDWIDTIYDAVEKQRQKSGYVANNDTVNALDNLYNEYTNNQAVQSKNIQNNIDTSKMNLVDSAKAYNLNGNDETIQSINQKLNDRGIASRFDGKLFTNADGTPNKNINALWRTTTDENGNTHREIVFNPYVDGDINEQKTMQQVTIHEMLHDMAGDEKVKKDLFNLVLEKNKTRDGYSDARSNLDEMYSQVYDKNSKDFKDLVDEEEVADTLAQKLGDQDFINSLNKEKPNVFKRIYDWVVDKLNKFTGSKNEKIYWEDVKNKFESAYKREANNEILSKNILRYSLDDKQRNKISKISKNAIDEKGNLKAFKQQLQEYKDKKLPTGVELIVAKDNDGLRYAQVSDKPIVMNQSNINKILINKHSNIDSTILENIDEELQNSVFAMDSRSRKNSKVIVLDKVDNNGNPIIATIYENKKSANIEVNELTSVYEKNKFQNLINSTAKEGYNCYTNKKTNDWLLRNRLQLPTRFAETLVSTNSIPTSNNNVNTTNNNSMQESENNSGSFNLSQNNTLNVPTKKLTENQRQNRLEYLKNIDTSNMKLLEKSKIKSEIRALENGYNSVEEMKKADKAKEQKTIQEYKNKQEQKIKEQNNVIKNNSNKLLNKSHKEQQLDLIQKYNPMLDDYHTGIRDVDDIKTFKEAYDIAKKEASDGGWDEYASYPDITNEMIEDSLKTGKITVYSSNDIKNGAFVTPSYEQALEYAGNDSSKVKSKKVNVDEVAWINLDEGQYAKVDNSNIKPSIEQSGAWQSFLENQIGSTGKGKTVQELRLPTKETINSKNNAEHLPDTKRFLVEKRSKTKVPIKDIKDRIAQKVINKGHYIDKLAKKTGDKNLTYLYDRTLNSFNEAQISIGENQVNSKGEVVGKSLNAIFKQAEDMKLNVDFEDYLLNKHNIARTAFGKSLYGDNVSAPQSKKIAENYEKQYPEFKEWAKEVNKYNDNNLKDLVDNGLVSKGTYDKLKEMYGDYVPTYRDITETMQEFEDNRIGSSALKAATKSDKKILSVKESMAEQTLAIKKAIRINNIGKELYKILGKDSKIMGGIEVDPTLMYTIDGEVVEKAKDGQNTFAIFNDGEITYFKISDEIYSAFSKDTLQNRINNSEVAKALLTPVEKLSQAQRNLLTTYSIGFAFNNPIKDFQDAVFNSKYGTGQFLKNYSKALYNIARNGDWYKSYKNNGGTANTYFDYNKGLLPTKTKNPIRRFVNKIKDANEILEQAPRLAEYISTIENNGSINEALYNSAEITTNFKRGGDIAKVANKYGANFLNASIQGLDKFYRNLSGQNGWKGYASLITKATLFQVVPSIVNGLLLKDDDDYSDLPEYTKDNYFLFKIGDGKFFRIPKGRVSSLIGGLSRRVLETAEGKEVNWKSLVDTTVNQMAPNNPFSDNVLAPIKQAIENKAWYGGEIVSSRLQKLPTAEQYDEKTDNLSKIIGKYTGISPKKINYVLDQYSGGIGDVLLPMMTPQAENNILEDKFTTDAILKNKNVSKYYEEVDNLEKNKNSENATDNDILKYKYMTEVSKDLSDLYSEKRNIENSNLSDKEKKVKVRKVQKEINNIVEERLDNVETINSNSKVAKIGDSQYYKYHGEWTKLSDDEKEKNKKISLKSYADFKNKVYNETEKQRKSGDLKENQQLKNTSKSEILLKSNYSNKEKLALYKNYVSSTDKKVEVAVEKLNMPIDVYLNYKTNQFENDKDKDGETISGTKKQKVYNYVNSLDNVDLIYKYMIVKMEGINDSDGDKAIINYVNKSQKFNFEERKEALKTLGFKVDKYGNVENMIFIPIKSKIK